MSHPPHLDWIGFSEVELEQLLINTHWHFMLHTHSIQLLPLYDCIARSRRSRILGHSWNMHVIIQQQSNDDQWGLYRVPASHKDMPVEGNTTTRRDKWLCGLFAAGLVLTLARRPTRQLYSIPVHQEDFIPPSCIVTIKLLSMGYQARDIEDEQIRERIVIHLKLICFTSHTFSLFVESIMYYLYCEGVVAALSWLPLYSSPGHVYSRFLAFTFSRVIHISAALELSVRWGCGEGAARCKNNKRGMSFPAN